MRIPNPAEHQGGILTLHEDITEERALVDAKDLMLRAVGHEVRSPAAAMRATIASLLQRHPTSSPARDRNDHKEEQTLNSDDPAILVDTHAAGIVPVAW